MTNPFALDTPPSTTTTSAVATAPAPAGNPFGAVTAPAAPAQPTADPFAGGDPFSGPAPQEARGPRLRDIYGRLVLLVPHKLEVGVTSQFKNPDGSPQTQDRMTTDVIVLDGGTIQYGGKPEKVPPIPHTKTAEVPHRTVRMYISSAGLVSQCRDALAARLAGKPGMVLGRLTRGSDSGKGEPPWLLTPPTEDDKNIARRYLATVDPFA